MIVGADIIRPQPDDYGNVRSARKCSKTVTLRAANSRPYDSNVTYLTPLNTNFSVPGKTRMRGASLQKKHNATPKIDNTHFVPPLEICDIMNITQARGEEGFVQ